MKMYVSSSAVALESRIFSLRLTVVWCICGRIICVTRAGLRGGGTWRRARGNWTKAMGESASRKTEMPEPLGRGAAHRQRTDAGPTASVWLGEDELRLALEACPSGMVISDAAGTIVLVNAEIETLFGYERCELVGQSVDMLLPPRLRGKHPRQREAFAAHPGPRAIAGRDLWAMRKDGTEFPVEVGLNPIHTRGGMLVLSVVIDLTERKRHERLKDEFVAMVSHELRTPLTSIAGSLGLLVASAAGKLPDNVARLLTIAHSNSQRLARLINDILDIERIESGKVVFDFRPVEIRSLVEQAIEADRGFAESYRVRVRLAEDAVSGEVCVDVDRMVQVMTNLLSNAIKFSSADEEVAVTIESREAAARICVRDHGPGIPDNFKPRMFDKFAQADGSDARNKSGTGLGLSIVKQIVTRLGGEIGFFAAEGGGTVFYVDLPWFRRAAEQLEHAAAQPHAGQLPKEHDGENAAIETEVA
jgi:PAS domain S-box-containing protein